MQTHVKNPLKATCLTLGTRKQQGILSIANHRCHNAMRRDVKGFSSARHHRHTTPCDTTAWKNGRRRHVVAMMLNRGCACRLLSSKINVATLFMCPTANVRSCAVDMMSACG
eukprot:scaffold77948_cov32-Tisochrysis_lutea.AAC.1